MRGILAGIGVGFNVWMYVAYGEPLNAALAAGIAVAVIVESNLER